VGGAAVHIAHKLGARLLGTVRNKGAIARPGTVPVDVWIDLETTDLALGTRNATFGAGADVILDVVGGPMFEKCLEHWPTADARSRFPRVPHLWVAKTRLRQDWSQTA